MNKAGEFQGQVVAIQPTPRGKVVPKLNRQDSLYTLIHRGIDQGKTIEKIEVINSISRGINPYSDWSEVLKVAESQGIEFVFSNTTEAGLQYADELYEEEISPFLFQVNLLPFCTIVISIITVKKEKAGLSSHVNWSREMVKS